MAIWCQFKTALKWLLLLVLALILAFLLWVWSLQWQPVRAALAGESLVQTDAGWVQGWRLPGRSIFLGIPYAQAPVGDLRWAAPQAAEKWGGARMANVVPARELRWVFVAFMFLLALRVFWGAKTAPSASTACR